MRTAARIGYVFGMDPVAVMEETATLRQQIRTASLLVWSEDQEAMFEGMTDG